MKIFPAILTGTLLCLGLSSTLAASKPTPVVAKPAKPAIPAVTQDQSARFVITGILRGLPIDTLLPYFEDSVKESVTPENIKGFQEQIGWLSRFIGDSLDPLMTGTQVLDSNGRTAFFREYRFASETNKRAPLIVIHLFFEDSLTPLIAGAYNKNFDSDTKNRIADAQIWKTPSGEVDVHSVSYVEFDQGVLPVLRVYDDHDTVKLDSVRVAAKGGPMAREAIARGYLDQIKAAKPNSKILERFGISFIRRDPAEGYGQYSFALAPESFAVAGKSKKATSKTKKKSK